MGDREHIEMVRTAARLLESIAGKEEPWKGAEAFFTQIVDPGQPKGEVVKTARFHMHRVRRIQAELLHRRQSLRENPARFWLEYDPTAIYPESSGLSAMSAQFWFEVDAVLTMFATMADGDTGRRDRCSWTMDRAIKIITKDPVSDEARNRQLKRQAVESFGVPRPLLCGMTAVAQRLREEAGRHEWKRMLVSWGDSPLPLCTAATILMEALEAKVIAKGHQNRPVLTCLGTDSVYMAWAAAEVLRTAQAVGLGGLSPGEGAEKLGEVDLLMMAGLMLRWVQSDTPDKLRLLPQLNNLEHIPFSVGLGIEALSFVAKAAERNGCPGAQAGQLEWVKVEAAADGAGRIAEYAERKLMPEIAEKANRHMDELMDYAVQLLNGEAQ